MLARYLDAIGSLVLELKGKASLLQEVLLQEILGALVDIIENGEHFYLVKKCGKCNNLFCDER
jgi:hypothetical protein